MENLEFSDYKNETFFLKKKGNLKELSLLTLKKREFQTIYDILDNAVNTYQISKKSVNYLKEKVEPRLSEINKIIWKNKDLPDEFQLEIEKTTRNALLEAISKRKIINLLLEKNLPSTDVREKLKKIKFK